MYMYTLFVYVLSYTCIYFGNRTSTIRLTDYIKQEINFHIIYSCDKEDMMFLISHIASNIQGIYYCGQSYYQNSATWCSVLWLVGTVQGIIVGNLVGTLLKTIVAMLFVEIVWV